MRASIADNGDSLLNPLTSIATPSLTLAQDGTVASWRHGPARYLAAWPTAGLAQELLVRAATDAGLETQVLPEGLRLRRAGNRCFAFNYSNGPINLPKRLTGEFALGQARLQPAGVAVLHMPRN